MSSSSIEPQQESHQRIGYDTSARKWAGQGIAVISDRSGQVLLSVPIQFLSQGLVNNFGFVLQSIHMSYDVKDGQIRSDQGVECSLLDAVTPGRFVYWNSGMHRLQGACLAISVLRSGWTANKTYYFSTSSRHRDCLLQATHRTPFQVHVETSSRWR